MSDHERSAKTHATVQGLVRTVRERLRVSGKREERSGAVPVPETEVTRDGELAFADLLTRDENPDPVFNKLVSLPNLRAVEECLREVRELLDTSGPEVAHLTILYEELLRCRLFRWRAGGGTEDQKCITDGGSVHQTAPPSLISFSVSETLLDQLLAAGAAAASIGSGRRPEARHSPDFRSVVWFGIPYSFTASQADCVRLLWQAWENDTPDVSQQWVMAEAGLPRCDDDVSDEANADGDEGSCDEKHDSFKPPPVDGLLQERRRACGLGGR